MKLTLNFFPVLRFDPSLAILKLFQFKFETISEKRGLYRKDNTFDLLDPVYSLPGVHCSSYMCIVHQGFTVPAIYV